MGKIQIKLNVVLLLIVVASLISCNSDSTNTGSLIDFVPENAALVLKFNSLSDLQNDLKQNEVVKKLLGESGKNSSYKLSQMLFSKEDNLLKALKPVSESILSFNKENDSTSSYTFITKYSEKLLVLDSIKNKTVESLQVDNLKFQRITIGKDIAFTAVKDSVFIASSSQVILQDILKRKTQVSKDFKKVYSLPSSNGLTVLLKDQKLRLNDSTSIAFTAWSSMELNIAPESFVATGIAIMSDSIPQILEVFKGQVPQQNDIAELIPHDAKAAISFTFSDAEKLQKNLSEFRKEKNNILSGVFDATNEVGEVQLQEENIIILKSIDAALSIDALAKFVSTTSSFREVSIKSFNAPALFQKTFSPLISGKNANYMFQIDNFFVFTEKETTAETMISLILNNATLKNASYFEKANSDLSNASSLLVYNLNGDFSQSLSGFFKLPSQKNQESLNFKNIPLAAFQFTFDQNFAHIIVSAKEIGASSSLATGSVSEKFNLKLENDILGDPQFFTNPGKTGSSILVQDIKNQLHFISESGKILWSKNINAPILGDILEIDFFDNGNIQMAFTTKNAFYILDRTGKEIGPYPIKYKDEITQPLAVFDYDNNHNYRFIIVQGNNLLMYDKNGKLVKGFGFSKTASNIVQVPQHIRMGSKDYIVIAEENGKLNILSRVGQVRIPVSKTFQFSEIPITQEDNALVIITKQNIKEIISESGKLSSIQLDVGNNYWFTTNGSTKVSLDENLLRINGKLIELPLGVYGHPSIFSINRNNYISLTETHDKKVYVFDKNGNTLNGFPVYGSSKANLGRNASKNGFGILVKDGQNSIISYEL